MLSRLRRSATRTNLQALPLGVAFVGTLAMVPVFAVTADRMEDGAEPRLADSRKGVVIPNPFEGMSDEEAGALADAAVERSKAALIKFAEETFPTLGLDIASLPRTEYAATMPITAVDLQAAVKAADQILLIEVGSVRFEGIYSTVTEAKVEESWMGPKAGAVTFEQLGSVVNRKPGINFEGGVALVEDASTPLLIPGDRAVVFLVNDRVAVKGASGRVLPYTGLYRVVDGQIIPTEYASGKLERWIGGDDLDALRRKVGELLGS